MDSRPESCPASRRTASIAAPPILPVYLLRSRRVSTARAESRSGASATAGDDDAMPNTNVLGEAFVVGHSASSRSRHRRPERSPECLGA